MLGKENRTKTVYHLDSAYSRKCVSFQRGLPLTEQPYFGTFGFRAFLLSPFFGDPCGRLSLFKRVAYGLKLSLACTLGLPGRSHQGSKTGSKWKVQQCSLD